MATIGLFVSGERNVEVARESAEAAGRSANAAKDAADAARDSVKLAERNAERQLRAYVYFDGGFLKKSIEGGTTHLIVRQMFKNYGQTPAYKYRAWGGIIILDAKNPV